jgi:AraC-like DNA-binding protein/uncharacterized Tic20 family protein
MKLLLKPFDLLFLATIFVGLCFSLLLLFAKRKNHSANIFLGLAVLTIVCWIAWVFGISVNLGKIFPHWNWIPLQFSLTLGPLIYFYIRKLTYPERKMQAKDLLHFSPFLLEQAILIVEIIESNKRQIATYDTTAFNHLNPPLQLLALISIINYLLKSLGLLAIFHQELKENFSDIYQYQLNWLKRLLLGFALLWLLWIPFVAVDYFKFHYHLGIEPYYPLYFTLAAITIWIGVEAFLRPEIILLKLPNQSNFPVKQVSYPGMEDAVIDLKNQMRKNFYYRNAELSLSSLALAMKINPHELSRIINTGTGKNFNDFINEYRVDEVIAKMKDPAYEQITLIGIAFDSGFNSKTTFNRTFKNITGKSPSDYKNGHK